MVKKLKNYVVSYIGLGKMGLAMVKNMLDQGHTVIAHNRSFEAINQAAKCGALPAFNLEELFFHAKVQGKNHKQSKKIVWLMLPAGSVTEQKIKEILPYLKKGDVIIDGSNSNFKDAKRRAAKLKRKGINFVDVGVSGGPNGARNGACMMIGGQYSQFRYLKDLYRSICVSGGFEHFEGAGCGHYVKMVHNGIEYGIMQSIAEGFEVLKKTRYKPDLKRVATVYQHGSIIESKLMQMILQGLEKFGDDLKIVPGSAGSGGASAGKLVKAEADWTIEDAKILKVEVPAIKSAVKERKKSKKKPSFKGKIINAMRNQFGGHSLKKK